MRSTSVRWLFAAVALATGALQADDNPVKLMIPKADATVSVLTEGQKAFFALPDETRRLVQGNAVTRAEWLALGWHPQAVAFVWDGFKTRKEQVRFRIWREEDDVCVCDTNFLYLTTGRFEWDNFRVGTAYRWGLDVKGKGSSTSRFVTEDVPPRLIRVPGVPNLRDLGGWKTADGRRVRQGLLYRSANLCENAAECKERPPRSRMTPATCHYMTNALGIRTELDLRSPRECEGLVVSPLGPSVRRVEISSGSYSQMNQSWAKEAVLKDLRLVADGQNLPLLFHCSGGRDRTGTLAFIVNGLLGVSAEDLARDWDATALWDNERDWFNRSNSYAALLTVMDKYPGSTLNERIEAYVKSIGFGDDEITRLRELLLEPKAVPARRIADRIVRNPLPGFVLELFDGKTGTVRVASCDFAAPAVKRAGGWTRLVWKGHPRLGIGFTATAEGVMKDDAMEWTFACSGNASELPLGRIAFPVVDVPCADTGYLLHSPYAGGGTMGWKKRVNWKDLACGASVCSTLSPGFRFVAVLNGEGRDSHYLDVRDPATNAGRFEVRKGAAGMARLSWVHDLPLEPATAAGCKLPYVATVRAYRGDWFEAASFYREWVKTMPRYAAAKSRNLSKVRGIGLWMWNRGLAETVIPPVERFQKDTGLQVALDWYWWFKEMPGTFYPDYWPPREGPEKFKADVQRLKRMGVFTQVYLNGMTWDEDAPSWKDGGLDSVAMRRDGGYFSCAYNRFNPNHRLANLCGEAPKFQTRIHEQIAHLVDCGFDSIYLDMIGCNAYGPCFNPAHRHPKGGGTHMTDDFRAYLKGVKAAFPGILLSTEDCGEAYADVFDSHISTHSSYERHGWIGTAPDMEFVPVFKAIWHGAVAVFGNYAIVDNVPYWDPRWPMKPWWTGHEEHLKKDYPDQFAVEFSRGPVWGLQPSVHNFNLHHATNVAYAAEYRFIRDTTRFYHDNREFLFDGEMRSPGRLVCSRKKVSFAKVSVFDEKVAAHESALPTVFHNVWRAPDGRIAAILVNWTREPQAWELATPDVSDGGVLPPRSWKRVDARVSARR